jgi:UDP-glucuronate decarboxylase
MMDYHRQNKVDIRIVRIFNTYGPRMAVDDGRVVSNFIVQALRGEPLTMYGDGSQTRSFCYVSDLIDGLRRMMDAEDLIGPVNLGNPAEFTIAELAERVLRLTGSRSKIVRRPLRRTIRPGRRRSPRLGEAGLGARVLEEGCRTIDYFRGARRMKLSVDACLQRARLRR